MRTFILLLTALLWKPMAHAQAIPDAQVPPLAFVALQQLRPQARNVKWKRVQGWYQASYMQSNAPQLVRFDMNGEVQATGHDIALGALPLPVQHTLATYYPTRTICQAYEVVNTHTGGLIYEMATCETNFSRTITLTGNGRKLPRRRPQ